jgi:hypothetical protein
MRKQIELGSDVLMDSKADQDHCGKARNDHVHQGLVPILVFEFTSVDQDIYLGTVNVLMIMRIKGLYETQQWSNEERLGLDPQKVLGECRR